MNEKIDHAHHAISGEKITIYQDGTKIIDDISFEIPAGKITGIIGPNGAGKSTLLKTVLGLTKINHGIIKWNKNPLDTISIKNRGKMAGYVAQGAICHWPMTVENIVDLGYQPHHSSYNFFKKKNTKFIEETLELFQIQHLKHRTVPSLSGGERARVMLARAFIGNPEYLLVDEPIADLDPGHQLHVMDILKSLPKNDQTVVIVIHDLNLALRYCDHLILLNDGRIQASGPAKDVLSAENIKTAYQIEIHKGSIDDFSFLLPFRRCASS